TFNPPLILKVVEAEASFYTRCSMPRQTSNTFGRADTSAQHCSLYALTGICAMEYIKGHGIRLRNHCGAEPSRDIEPPRRVTAVGWRDRASTRYDAADRVKAPESAARGRYRRMHGGRTASSL